MSGKSSVTAEQVRQIEMLLDGRLDAAEFQQLSELMTRNEDLRHAYLRCIEMHAMLQWCHGSIGQRATDEVDASVILELLEEAEQAALRAEREIRLQEAKEAARAAAARRNWEKLQRRHVRRPEPLVIPWSVVYIATGAVAVALAMFVHSFWQLRPTPQVALPEPASNPQVAEPEPVAMMVATIDDSVDARWSDPSLSTARGTQLANRTYYLAAGIVRISFSDGAKALIEAPAEIELLSTSRARLQMGRLVGQVPSGTTGGFTVETPHTTIVDLGTEFGVLAEPDGNAEVHVFDGEVSVAAGESSEPTLIQVGQAVHVDGKTHETSFREADTTHFARRLPVTVQYAGMHEGIGEYLRTSSVAKPLDADGDQVFGTAGYYFFNSNDAPKTVIYVDPFENLLFEKPAFVAALAEYHNGIAAGKGAYSVHGMPGYLDIDDPRLAAGAEVSNVNSGVLSYSPSDATKGPGNLQGARPGTEIELCRILLGEGIPLTGFRLGVFTDNGDVVETVPAAIRLTVDKAEARTSVESKDLNGDMYFFDIVRAQPGDVLVIHLLIDEAFSFASIGGLTFDVLGASPGE